MRDRGSLSLVLFVCASAIAFGQGTTSRVLGTVQDSSGAVVPAASVKLINEGTHLTFETKTSASGAYAFEAVQTGTYQLDVEASGFRKFSSHNNLVDIGVPTTVNVKLELGTLVDTVEVQSSAEAVQTSNSGNYGNLISGTAVKDLPIVGSRGRNPLDLVVTQPGVVSGAPTGGGIYVHGARDRAWNYTLDGIDTNDSSQGGSNTTSFRVNPDMLDEMRILTGNNTAENGRNSGGQVAMVTRSGTNSYHGDGFWFYRTPRLNANEWQNNLANLGKAQLQQNIFGGGIGGPVIKNKTFFFFQLQELRARSSAATSRTVYTATARTGVLRYVKGGRNQPAGSAAASVDANGNPLPGLSIGTYNVAANDPQHIGLDPTVLAEIKNEPLPNQFNVGDGLNTAGYIFSAQASERQHDQTIKIDQIVNAKNTVYGRVAWGRDDSICDVVNTGQPVFPGGPCLVNTLRGPRNFAVNWRFTPTSRMTNELVVGENRYDPIFGQPSSLDKISFTGTPVDNTEQYYFGNSRVVSTWQVVDNFAYFRGAHAFKFGTNLRRVREEDIRGSVAGLNSNEEVNFSTAINTVDPATFGLPADLNTSFDRPDFQSNINFMLGRVGQFDRGFVNQNGQWTKNNFQFDTRYPEYEFYAQDTWKVKPNLTVDLGLRYEIRLSPSTPANNILVPNQAIVAGGAPSDTVQWVPGQLFKNQLGNFGPSLGFAWDPFRTGKTSIRANYRIAYDRINDFVVASTILPNLPGNAFAAINTDFGQNGGRLANLPALNPPSASPSSLTQPAAFSSASNTVVDPNLKTPLTHQWALDIQRQVSRDTIVDIAYIGRRAYHLLGAYNVNQAQIYTNGFLDAFNTVKAGNDSPLIDNLLEGRYPPQRGRDRLPDGAPPLCLQPDAQFGGRPGRFPRHAFTERRFGDPTLHRAAVRLHSVPAVHQPERARLQRFLYLPRVGSAVDAPPLPGRLVQHRLHLVQGAGYAFVRSDAHRGRHRQRVHRGRHAVRYQQPQAQLRAQRFRPPPRLPVELRCRTSLRQGQALPEQRRQVGSGTRRLGSHRLRTPHQRPSLHGVLRFQHGQQRQPVHRQLQWMRPRRRHPVPRSGFRPDLVLRRRRTRQILRPRRRPVRQYRPQLLRRPPLFRNRRFAPQAHSRDGAHQARVPRRRHQPDQQSEFRRAHHGHYQFDLRTHQQLAIQQFAQDSARRQDPLLAGTVRQALSPAK